MSNVSLFKKAPSAIDNATLMFLKTKAKDAISAVKIIDAETKQTVLYVPSLEVSGYGNTEDRAKEMLAFSLADILAPSNFIYIKHINNDINLMQYQNRSNTRNIIDRNSILK